MSPAGWILIVIVVLILGAPIGVLLVNAEGDGDGNEPPEGESGTSESRSNNGTDADSEESDSGESDDASQMELEPDEEEPNDATAPEDQSPANEDQSDSGGGTDRDPSEHPATSNGWDYASRYEQTLMFEESHQFGRLKKPGFDPERQSEYNDTDDPDRPSERIKEAVEWVVEASTEAIHQQSKFNEFINNLEAFVEQPRAAGAETIAETPWRERSPNLSRLIGERFLSMTLGLSARGSYEMEPHKNAFIELLGETWNDDGLGHPLVYQGIGRMGLLTATSYVDLQHQLIERIPGRTPRTDNPDRLEAARFHALLLAVAPGDRYPFPQSERGLSRLWHWDEHNPPLADWNLLPPVLFALWVHHNFQETESDAANDFGALLGNWWDENEPNRELFETYPGIWEAMLLTAWVLLADHRLIWNQIEERFEELDFDEDSSVTRTTRTILGWVEEYSETGQRPDDSLAGDLMPPVEWISPLPSDLLNDRSQPSFDFPDHWCEGLKSFSVQRNSDGDQ